MPVTHRVLVYSVEEIKELAVKHFAKKVTNDKAFLHSIVENREKIPNVGTMTTNAVISYIIDEMTKGDFKFEGLFGHEAIMVFKADSDSYLTLWPVPGVPKTDSPTTLFNCTNDNIIKQTPKIGDRVTITDGSSDGHTGIIVAIKKPPTIRVKHDADGEETDVSFYYIHKKE